MQGTTQMQINIPQDLKIEVFCLAAILNHIDAANEAFSTLDDSDFSDADHKRFYAVMKSTFTEDTGCSLYTIMNKMDKQEGNFTKDYLLYLSSSAWSGMPYEEYFASLRNLTGLRKSVYAAQELLLKATKPNAVYEEVIADHQSKILGTMGINNSCISAKDLYSNYKNNMSFIDYSIWKREQFLQGKPTYEGVKSHFPLLDQTLGTFQNGALYYFGARTSMGKTTVILNIMNNMMKSARIGMFSLEMEASMILEKLLCIHCDIKYSEYSIGNFTNEELERMRSVAKIIGDDRIFFEPESGMSLAKLTTRAKRMKKSYNIDVLFIDYLTLIKADSKHPNKHMQVDEISKGLQALAKSLKIPIICLAQLNRASIGKDGDRPSLAHFRESGSIEEDADGCILIHRPEYYNANNKPGHIEFIVAKNRIMGTLKTIDYHCDFKISDRYKELPPIDEQMRYAQEREFEAKKKQFDDEIFGRD